MDSVVVFLRSDPYLLVAANEGIIRINIDGSDYQTFVEDVGVVAIDYHYG